MAVFIGGLAAAVWSGIATYRAVGIYGGPITSGFHREWDPGSRSYELIHETTTSTGTLLRHRYGIDLRSLLQTDITLAGSELPITVTPTSDKKTRVGFSSVNDGVVDAWAVADQNTGKILIDVSTKRNGKIDRWEHYEKGVLVRVDLDTNGNGKPDRWQTYEGGILMDTFIDANEDGRPDGPPSP
jgi:hypothetical protein